MDVPAARCSTASKSHSCSIATAVQWLMCRGSLLFGSVVPRSQPKLASTTQQQFDLFTLELPAVHSIASIVHRVLSSLQRGARLPAHIGAATNLGSAAAANAQTQDSVAESDSALRALQEGKVLGFGFSAGGFLFAYHCGVVNTLRQWKLLDATTPLAGVSAGSLVAALVKCDVPTEDIQNMYFECVGDLRSNGTAGRMREVLRAAMERHLPSDAHLRCSGSLHVGVSYLYPYPHHTQISQFHSRDDLIEVLLTSCHLPGYSSSDWSVMLQGKRAVDGGFTAIVPSLPESSSAHTVKVCALPASRVARLPFLNKKQAMANVAIMPDHPRHYHDSRSTRSTCTPTSSTPSSTPASPCHGSPAARMGRCQSAASPFSSDALQQQQQQQQQVARGAEEDQVLSSSTGSSVSLSSAASGGLSRASSGSGTSTSGSSRKVASLAAVLGRHLSALSTQQETKEAATAAAITVAPQADFYQHEQESSALPYDLGDNPECSEHPDIVQEMVAWINKPAPDDEFYVRLMRKAERDTEAWVQGSGLARHLSDFASASSSPRSVASSPRVQASQCAHSGADNVALHPPAMVELAATA